MKSALTVVLFLLFTIGVCVDGNEVSVTEGDSVTLKSGVTEIQTHDGIEWRFSGTRIAKISRGDSETWVKPDGSFRDRLQLDRQTGDLKISNIRTTDSGEYKVKISSPRGSSEMIFTVNDCRRVCLTVADGLVGSLRILTALYLHLLVWMSCREGRDVLDMCSATLCRASEVVPVVVKSVSVLEGYPVTLQTGLTEIQTDDEIQWRFGQQKSPVAEIIRDAGIFNTSDVPDGKFKDRLNLDHQTGSLTINNTRTTDSGLYEVRISRSRSRYTRHYTRSFRVTVRDYVEPVSVLKGDNVTLHTGLTGTDRIEQIRWTFGDDKFIADLNGTVNKDNFGLNKQTGDLTIRNIQRDQYGDYKLEIKTRTMILHRKYRITVIALPDPGLSPAAVAGIGVGGVVVGGVVCFLLGAAVAGVICYCCKRSKNSKDSQIQNQPLKGQLADDTENVSMKNLCGSQSAGSDTENSPFREIKGNKEHGYEIL